jgi:hypothetical protein
LTHSLPPLKKHFWKLKKIYINNLLNILLKGGGPCITH